MMHNLPSWSKFDRACWRVFSTVFRYAHVLLWAAIAAAFAWCIGCIVADMAIVLFSGTVDPWAKDWVIA